MPPHTRPAVQNSAVHAGGGTTTASKLPTTGLHFCCAKAGLESTTDITLNNTRDFIQPPRMNDRLRQAEGQQDVAGLAAPLPVA